MRYPGILALAAFLAACTPAGMAPAPGPVPVMPGATGGMAPTSGVAPVATTPTAPAGTVAADDQQVEISGDVMAPAGVHAAGTAPAAALWLLAAGEEPVVKAPVQILDPITGKELGRTTTDDKGHYRLQLGVKVAKGGKMLQVAVNVVGPNGKPIRLFSLTRIEKSDGVKVETNATVNAATTMLATKILAKADATERNFVVQDFLAAVARLDAALRSEDLDGLDLGDPLALSNALKDIAEGDTTLAELVKGLEGGDDDGDDEGDAEDDDSGSSGGGDDDDDGDDTTDDDDASDDDPDDSDDETRTPILSGTIK